MNMHWGFPYIDINNLISFILLIKCSISLLIFLIRKCRVRVPLTMAFVEGKELKHFEGKVI